MGFRLASNLTLDNPEGSKVNVKILRLEISRKRESGDRYEVGLPGALICRTYGLSIGTIRFDLGWPWGVKKKVILLTWNMSRTTRVTMLDPVEVSRQQQPGPFAKNLQLSCLLQYLLQELFTIITIAVVLLGRPTYLSAKLYFTGILLMSSFFAA